MGYCIDLTDHNFKIKKENEDKVLHDLKEFIKSNGRPMWVTPREVINSENIIEAFDAVRYELVEDENGDYVLEYFHGEKLGDDCEILNSIAKYVEVGSFIEFLGEDDESFRLTFNGEKCIFID
jgi:hypothetical protein